MPRPIGSFPLDTQFLAVWMKMIRSSWVRKWQPQASAPFQKRYSTEMRPEGLPGLVTKTYSQEICSWNSEHSLRVLDLAKHTHQNKQNMQLHTLARIPPWFFPSSPGYLAAQEMKHLTCSKQWQTSCLATEMHLYLVNCTSSPRSRKRPALPLL